MKKIVCELCECTEFTKADGVFTCNNCGTSYSLEEAKAMMKEVEGAAPVVGGGAPAVNPNQQQLENILVLASSAYEAENYKEAESYCNRAIEIDATTYKAWNLKGKAVGWQSSMDNLRIEEAAHSFCKAIDFAPEEEKEELKNQAVEELKRLGLALIQLRKKRFSASPDDAEFAGFKKDRQVLVSSLLVLLQHGNVVGMPDGYLDEIAKEMNYAGVAALNMAREAWNEVDHPGEKDFDTYLNWNVNICNIFREAIEASDEDEEEDIVRYKNLIIALEEPYDKHSWKREWNDFLHEYSWRTEYSLSDANKNNRAKEVKECKAKIKEIEESIKKKADAEAKKAEEEKKKRIEAYWEAHKDEKIKLENEKKSLNDNISELDAEIEKLDAEIAEIEKENNASTPAMEEVVELKKQISALESEKSSLGLFAGKEKKRIAEEISVIQSKVSEIETKAKAEREAIFAETEKKTAPLVAKKNEFNEERTAANNRIQAIDDELNKDPE